VVGPSKQSSQGNLEKKNIKRDRLAPKGKYKGPEEEPAGKPASQVV